MPQLKRIEGFTDAVIAIIITLMAVNFEIPEDATLGSLAAEWRTFLSFLLSFLYLGIYWNNHHELLRNAEHIKGKVLWANLHLLFWISFVPLTTKWMGVNDFDRYPVMAYGLILFMASIAWFVLLKTLINSHPEKTTLNKAFTSLSKERISLGIYLLGIITSYFLPKIGLIIYFLLAGYWIVPGQRINNLKKRENRDA